MIDEPTQSMDHKRQEAIAEFLANESQSNQVIVATEIPEFVEMVKKYSNNVIIHNLEPWSKEGAIFSS